jgi:arylsulfatase A-like enzyme
MERPNFLIITTDEQRGDCYGFSRRRVLTPHIDRIAAEGTVFGNCITPNLVCQPARASILTGLLPLTHGVRDNGIDLPLAAGEAGFAGCLSRAGYRTHLVGKAHFSTQTLFEGKSERPECRRNSDRFGSAWNGPYMGFETVDMLCFGHDLIRILAPPFGLRYENWFHADGNARQKLNLHSRESPSKDRATLPFTSHLPVEWHPSSWIAERTIDYITQENDDRPFCLWASFPDPHYPFAAPAPWATLHPEDDVDLPAHWTLDLERRPWWHRAFIEGKNDSILEIQNYRLPLLRSVDQERFLRRMIANYYGMIALADHAIGRLVDALAAAGRLENTIVIVTSDHGDYLGDHGLLLKGPAAYEGLLRVGLACRGPGIARGQSLAAPVSTLDIMPTLMAFAGVGHEPIHGRSLRPLLAGKPEQRDYAYSEWDMATFDETPDWRLRTVRTERHKLTVELGSGAGELYDLQEDPDEMDNLFADPGYQMVRRRLEDAIAARPHDVLAEPLPKIGWA